MDDLGLDNINDKDDLFLSELGNILLSSDEKGGNDDDDLMQRI